MDERDRILENLRLRERAEENVYFTRLERASVAKLRDVRDERWRRDIREFVAMRCPDCGARLLQVTRYGVTIEQCPAGHGLWMTESARQALGKRERHSWISRYLYCPKPVV